ncbi:helix-turn-helix protein [Kribbella orskensis]|uniref:Helix-turn-helix protein n=1 Tax=Kribbella orskensis TaxID=2512216 RepID=A0ABY2BHZ9_9ACTN|nr:MULTISPECIES: helix-turn-helix domain-containing protein [Kribbella]TCN38804.1 helix-turn-helix protein [Kribbella sp. VKM Ac-2500]TCO20985.1 helix-turn-helix protein [Kribbella orskensis]
MSELTVAILAVPRVITLDLGARRLLEESDWSVERIASATGFGTAANFRSAFRREVGTTPSTYRKSSGTSQVDEA